MILAINRFSVHRSQWKNFSAEWVKFLAILTHQKGFVRGQLWDRLLNNDYICEFHSEWLGGDKTNPPNLLQTFWNPEWGTLENYEVFPHSQKVELSHRNDFRSSFLDAKIEKAFAELSPEQKFLTEFQKKKLLPPIHVGALEGKILEVLLKIQGTPKLGLEIGTLGGMSASWLLKSMSPEGQLICIEKDPKRASIAWEFFEESGLSSRVDLRVGLATHVLDNLKNIKDLDFVFIDADKENYARYVEWVIPRLRSGGLILTDNSFIWGGMNYWSEGYAIEQIPYPEPGLHTYSREEFLGMSECWDILSTHLELTSVILPTGEGLGIAVKN